MSGCILFAVETKEDVSKIIQGYRAQFTTKSEMMISSSFRISYLKIMMYIFASSYIQSYVLLNYNEIGYIYGF